MAQPERGSTGSSKVGNYIDPIPVRGIVRVPTYLVPHPCIRSSDDGELWADSFPSAFGSKLVEDGHI